MAEKEIIYGEKIIKFPAEVMTVTIPQQDDNRNIYIEAKELGSEDNYKLEQKDFSLIKVVINIAFFVCEEKGKNIAWGLKPEASLRIQYDGEVEEEVGENEELILGWWNEEKRAWVPLPTTINEEERYGETTTPGWDKDPAIGWGKKPS